MRGRSGCKRSMKRERCGGSEELGVAREGSGESGAHNLGKELHPPCGWEGISAGGEDPDGWVNPLLPFYFLRRMGCENLRVQLPPF